MFTFSTLLTYSLTAFAALGAQTGHAAALEARQTPATCTTTLTGYLALRPASDPQHGTPIYAGIVNGVKHKDIQGKESSILVTRDASLNALKPQLWEFATCTSANGHALPPGYKTPTSGPTNNAFGIVRPAKSTQHCLAVESTKDTQTGAKNSLLDSYCSQVPEQYRLFMKVDYVYGETSYGHPLYFANQNITAVIGENTEHKELVFYTNDASVSPYERVQLTLLDPSSTAA